MTIVPATTQPAPLAVGDLRVAHGVEVETATLVLDIHLAAGPDTQVWGSALVDASGHFTWEFPKVKLELTAAQSDPLWPALRALIRDHYPTFWPASA